MTQWWVDEGGHPGILPGSNYGGGAGNTTAAGAIQWRSPLDAARAANGRIPQAEYPDGYLGNLPHRNGDKLLQTVKNTLTAQSYQRGVHKGSRIPQSSYYWPGGYQPESGLVREAAAQRAGNVMLVPKFAPTLDPVERLAHMGKTAGLASPGDVGRKMQEARDMGVSPAMNPVVPPDPKLMIPPYGIGRQFGSPGRST